MYRVFMGSFIRSAIIPSEVFNNCGACNEKLSLTKILLLEKENFLILAWKI